MLYIQLIVEFVSYKYIFLCWTDAATDLPTVTHSQTEKFHSVAREID